MIHYKTDCSSFNDRIIAFEDIDLLKSDQCRSVRLMLEFLKPDMMMDFQDIESTIIIFGSARIKSPEEAAKMVEEAQNNLALAPEDPDFKRALADAEMAVKGSQFYDVARRFAKIVTEADKTNGPARQLVVMTGGGGGIMEAGNRGANDANGLSIGVNITLPFEQRPNDYITKGLSFQMHYFCIRKMHFLRRSLAFACFPGGWGTFDELFEALTLIQTKIIKPVPVILFGREFWEHIVNWQLFIDLGLISPEDMKLFQYADTPEEGWQMIKDFYAKPENHRENLSFGI